MPRRSREHPHGRRLLRPVGLLFAGLVLAAVLWPVLFTRTSVETTLASHDAVLRPTLDGRVRLGMGPYVPDVRTSSGSRVGVSVTVGKTTASTTGELAQRYAAIASAPDAEVDRLERTVRDLALSAAARSLLLAAVPVALWLLVGPRRRRQLLSSVRPRSVDPHGRGRAPSLASLARVARVALVVPLVLVLAAVVLVWRWPGRQGPAAATDGWVSVQDAVGAEVRVPAGLERWQLQGGLFTRETRRLVLSLFDTYDRSRTFYAGVVTRGPEVADRLHAPADHETVAVLVSDRHDNIGMDAVARRVADEAGATVVLDAGDDTSTGASWESFSLESLDSAFDGYAARLAVAGNHDHGTFVSRRLVDLGWTHLTGAPVEEFGGVRVSGVDDPRSSGLGTWRDATGLSFAEVRERVADDVCALQERDERVATLLLHDASLGATALARGCTDLVLAGHLHAQVGPTRVVGENGRVGWSYTNGTTGGAAYAIAAGSKLRRDAELTLVTFRGGRPVGLQPVTVRTTGVLDVADYVELDLT